MRASLRLLLLLALPCLLAASQRDPGVRSMEARVVAIADGDTLTVLDADRRQHRVRLHGIDAPERQQPFSERSRQHLAQAVHQKRVRLTWSQSDRYGRLLAIVHVQRPRACGRPPCPVDAVDVNLGQVRAGLAWHYRRYAGEQSRRQRREYAAAEAEARAARRGLWAEAAPIAPWDWRDRNRRPGN